MKARAKFLAMVHFGVAFFIISFILCAMDNHIEATISFILAILAGYLLTRVRCKNYDCDI